MLSGVDDDSDMTAPNDQVTRLWSCDTNKIPNPGIQVKRVCVRITQSCYCVDFVNEMRTIGTWSTSSLTRPYGSDNGFALSRSYYRGHGGSSRRWRSTLSQGD